MRFFICLAALPLAACANLPQAERVGEFGKAATAATAFAKETITSNKTIALRIDDELLARQYITRKICPPKDPASEEKAGTPAPDGKKPCEDGPFALSGSRANVLSPDRTGVRVRALTALGEYGDALAKAANEGQIDKLQNAAVKLGDAAATLSGAFPPASPIAAPAIKVAARGVGFMLGHAYAAEINAVVETHNNDVIALSRLLHDDFAELADLLTYQAKTFEAARKSNLIALQRGGDIDRLRLYAEFKNARVDNAAVASLAEAAKKGVSIFGALAKTHDALAKNEPDAERTLRNFIALMDDMSTLVKAAQPSRKS